MPRFRLLPLVLAVCSVIAEGRDSSEPRPVPDADLTAIKTLLVRQYPELAASPGYLLTAFFPGIGEPGCDAALQQGAADTAQWVGTVGSVAGEIEIPQPTCSQPRASIYFAPYKQSGTRSNGAHAQCRAPVTHASQPGPWRWTCDRVVFRQYVQLEDQDCTVTLIGNLSDGLLAWMKEAGRSEIGKGGKQSPETLAMVSAVREGHASALFGDSECRTVDDLPHVFFMADDRIDPDAPDRWRVVDAREWMESWQR